MDSAGQGNEEPFTDQEIATLKVIVAQWHGLTMAAHLLGRLGRFGRFVIYIIAAYGVYKSGAWPALLQYLGSKPL